MVAEKKLWANPWIIKDGKVHYPIPTKGCDTQLRVSDILHDRTSEWNEERSNASFLADIGNIIRPIPIYLRRPIDLHIVLETNKGW